MFFNVGTASEMVGKLFSHVEGQKRASGMIKNNEGNGCISLEMRRLILQ